MSASQTTVAWRACNPGPTARTARLTAGERTYSAVLRQPRAMLTLIATDTPLFKAMSKNSSSR